MFQAFFSALSCQAVLFLPNMAGVKLHVTKNVELLSTVSSRLFSMKVHGIVYFSSLRYHVFYFKGLVKYDVILYIQASFQVSGCMCLLLSILTIVFIIIIPLLLNLTFLIDEVQRCN